MSNHDFQQYYMLSVPTRKQKQRCRKTLTGKPLGLSFSPVKASCPMWDFAFGLSSSLLVCKTAAETAYSQKLTVAHFTWYMAKSVMYWKVELTS